MHKTTNSQLLTKICKHQYHNPIYLALEWQKDLAEGKYSSQADLSGNLGISRTRVTQILNLLKLPEEIIEKVSAMGDNFPRQMVTERSLRLLLKNTSQP